MEKIFELLGWTNGQICRFWTWIEHLKNINLSDFSFKKLLSAILAIFELFNAAAFKTPVHPYGKQLDLTGYELVFEDNFDADELNTDVWYTRANGSRRSGYNGASQVKLENGNLIITGEHLKAGEFGEGWYAGAVAIKKKYTKGYFEIKCICNDSKDYWSAFWLQSDHSYDHEISNGGVGGAEIDIFEAFGNGKILSSDRNRLDQTVWCNGYDDDEEHLDKCYFTSIGDDIFHKYNTYGLEWTNDEYIFYINGVETGRTSFGNGVSTAEEELIVSLEIPENGITLDKSEKTEFIVDYVKVWQK